MEATTSRDAAQKQTQCQQAIVFGWHVQQAGVTNQKKDSILDSARSCVRANATIYSWCKWAVSVDIAVDRGEVVLLSLLSPTIQIPLSSTIQIPLSARPLLLGKSQRKRQRARTPNLLLVFVPAPEIYCSHASIVGDQPENPGVTSLYVGGCRYPSFSHT